MAVEPNPDGSLSPHPGSPSGRSVLASFSWLSVGVLASRLLQFAIIVYLTRKLGDDAFGLFAFVQAFLWFGVILTDFGFSQIGTREIARKPRLLKAYASTILPLRLVVFAMQMLVLVVLLHILPVQPATYWLFVFSFLSLLAYAVNTDWVFRGFERMEYVAAWESLPRVIWLAGTIAFVHSQDDLLKVPLLRFAGEITAVLLLLAVTLRQYPAGRPSLSQLRGHSVQILVREAAPIGMAALLAQIYYNFDTILLGLLKTNAVVGHYSAAYRVVTLLLTGSFVLAATYQPILARSFALDRPAFTRHLRRLAAAAFLFGVTLPAVVAAGALPIVRIVYGAEFTPAAMPLAILMAAMPFAYLGVAYGTALVAAGLQRQMLTATAAAAGSNVLANLLLIPPLGMTGAAIATVISYAAAWAIQWYFVHRRIGPAQPVPLAAVVETLREIPQRLRLLGRKPRH